MQDGYEFEYDCEYDWANPDEESNVQYTTINISVSRQLGKPVTYEVEYYINNTSGYDWQSLDYELFAQVEEQLLRDLAADGVQQSMLIYP